MREHEFRVWDKKRKRMCEVLAIDYVLSTVTIKYKKELPVLKIDLNDCILMESTGFGSRFGGDIFEGDFVSGIGGPEGVVKFGEYHFCYKEKFNCPLHEELIKEKSSRHWGWYIENKKYSGTCDFTYVDTIGNIYENPELLKEVSE